MTQKLIHAPFVEQMPELPRGCEVTSLSLLLQHAGIDKMTTSREVRKVPLKDGDYYGHLNDGFVRDMYSFETDGLGVYHLPIKELAERYLPNRIVDFTGSKKEDIYNTIDQGLPVSVVTNDTFKELGEEHSKLGILD